MAARSSSSSRSSTWRGFGALVASVEAREAALAGAAAGAADDVTAHVLAVACLPPGGGESALFERLRALDARVVSGDECQRAEAQRAQRGGRGDGAAGDFTQQLERALW